MCNQIIRGFKFKTFSLHLKCQERLIYHQNLNHEGLLLYVEHLESKERLRIQPAQLFNFS